MVVDGGHEPLLQVDQEQHGALGGKKHASTLRHHPAASQRLPWLMARAG
jgi:hypothetical protein